MKVARRVLGVDLSMNHAGFVVLDNGKLKDHFFVTDRASIGKKKNGVYLKAAKLKDMHQRTLLRIAFWHAYMIQVMKEHSPEYVGVEDYAYGKGQHAHQIGEVGSAFKYEVWKAYAKMRFHDVSSIKMFGADDGSADKSEMRLAVQERWKETKKFDKYVSGVDVRTVEDLCDAYVVAKMVWTEVLLRSGKMKLSDLSRKQVQVFNRTTSRWKVNVLGREWYQRTRR